MRATVERVYLENGAHLALVERHRKYATVRTAGRLKGRRIALSSLHAEPVTAEVSAAFLRRMGGKP